MGFLLSNTSRNDSRKTKTGAGRQNGWKEGEENRKRVEDVEEEGQSEGRDKGRDKERYLADFRVLDKRESTQVKRENKEKVHAHE